MPLVLLTVHVLAALLLALVFGVAGVAKLLDRSGSQEAARGFGVPEPLAGAVALSVAMAEVAVAVLLLPATTRDVAAAAGLGLLLAFSAAIAVAMAHGRAPECHCFGQLHSEPAGWRTLARNAALAGAAAFVLIAGPGGSAVNWIGDLRGAELLALSVGATAMLLLVLGAWALVHLLRSYGRVLVRLDRAERLLAEVGLSLDNECAMPEIGHAPRTPAPAFALPGLDGRPVTLDDLLEPEVPTLLLFTSPTCGPCQALMPKVAAWQREYEHELMIALVAAGDASAVRAEAEERGLENVLIDADLAAYTAYEANGTPSAVLVSPDATIASWVASGADWIERLVERTVSSQTATRVVEEALAVGEPAPDLELPDLEGHTVDLYLVLVDESSAAAGALRAGGTPMAVRIDAEGRIGSPLAAGASAVLDLLGAREPGEDLVVTGAGS